MVTVSAVQEFVAVRSREQVATAAASATASETCPETGGRAAAYRWALDPQEAAPITGRRRAVRTELDLAVEERAAIVRSRDGDLTATERAFARGVARALAWILGFPPIAD
ncbi:hypothetical protein GCM10010495_64000 [Kitasatospora herbaricolor]|uniref:hypothetical protein n=1 Tax=Kitasatospora herbaricolor TaxID=68217 RepID=UPI00174B3BB7|nr:hypothetical protein [Kitasatospora herbaricolor]MDQ0305922.1 hypothetical protein [Kitasatospora herbaricolor]GGV37980.1 hypothetical protein GCM10010495_64000 [Kitasatospora herbaricolor]